MNEKSADIYASIEQAVALWQWAESLPTVENGLLFLAADVHHPVLSVVREEIRAEETA